ncbi:General transcription factor IIH subunit 2 [Hondaea fermentalgiana]|uniref:General transcription factor IIH subunit 2 n=1 Tax=Hondaea fermentalgiana TaxID=2315210 RepID=A0A2R5G824_9STRA|nr:General transcription factor IIH subunit 2 [Hondaea fermentalgiana]|eukprot:GBG27202.1 General transcription factor IIH subunit 2 [Hondaea fermentalgiana]
MSGYAWETNLARSWEALQEDEHGVLRTVAGAAGNGGRGDGDANGPGFGGRGGSRRLSGPDGTLCRNMIRYLVLVVDMSQSMAESDLRPSRRVVTSELLNDFILSYFDENPLSNLCIVMSRDGVAQKLTDMSASATRHQAALGMLSEGGEFSLQNGLELAHAALQSVPQHGSREILVLMSSLSTCDQGDVFETIEKLQRSKVHSSVIGLSAEIYVAKYLAEKTLGRHAVITSKEHFRQLLQSHVPPAPALAEDQQGLRCTFVRMGFPSQCTAAGSSDAQDGRTLVSGHAVTAGKAMAADINDVTTKGYACPRCSTVVTELPTDCPICDLELIASAHLSRSYHHLFPSDERFDEAEKDAENDTYVS